MSATSLVASNKNSSLSLSLHLSFSLIPSKPLFAESRTYLSANRPPDSPINVQEVMLPRYGFHQYLFETSRFRQHNASRRVVASTAARLPRSFRVRSLLNLGSVPR